jgi:hypothetical protein
VKLNLFFFKASLFFLLQHPVPSKGSLQSYIRGAIEKESDIRPDSLRGEAIEAFDPFQVYPSTMALIGNSGVTETVAKNNPSLS